MTGKTFIFDLDDTLIFNQHYYSLADIELVRLIYDRLGPRIPSAHAILSLENEIDLKGVEKFGFGKERFPSSLAETYRQISERMGEPTELREKHAREAYNLGARVFDSRTWFPNLVPGAIETLEFLNRQRDELALLTTGDESVQAEKIRFYGISRWFGDRTHIVPHHKREKIVELAAGRDPKHVWFVGNSARSDIAPSLGIGIGAVYIPQETWAYDNHSLDNLDKTRLITLKSIKELPEIYSTKLA
jgi:putative hydrolase of the HAD superfamily